MPFFVQNCLQKSPIKTCQLLSKIRIPLDFAPKRKKKEVRALSSQPGSDKKSDYAHCSYFCLMFLAMLVHVPREAHFAPSRFTAGPLIRILKIKKSNMVCGNTVVIKFVIMG